MLLLLTGAKHGLLGVAGMMKLLVMKWIIPSFPALSTSKIIDDCPSNLHTMGTFHCQV